MFPLFVNGFPPGNSKTLLKMIGIAVKKQVKYLLSHKIVNNAMNMQIVSLGILPSQRARKRRGIYIRSRIILLLAVLV